MASAELPDDHCAPWLVHFRSKAVNAASVQWFFGDGQSSGLPEVSHRYASPGNYTVLLVAYNPAACNRTDTFRKTITVSGALTAAFAVRPVPPQANQPLHFSNRSTGADSYSWMFGDGIESADEHPEHLYPRTGTYIVCLTAIRADCLDSVCHPVQADITPLAAVPKAFSPNGDGHNDRLFVHGAGIEAIDFRVFNRWGREVFATADLTRGWDGTVNGMPQEMDGYAWILQVRFADGSSRRLSGNVTLIR